jgi:hypothetical protein
MFATAVDIQSVGREPEEMDVIMGFDIDIYREYAMCRPYCGESGTLELMSDQVSNFRVAMETLTPVFEVFD